MSSSNNDEQLYGILFRGFVNGEKEAVGELMRLLYNDLYAYSLRITGDHDMTKDCIQNIFFNLWENRKEKSKVTNVKPYLLVCLRNESVKQIQLQNRNSLEIVQPISITESSYLDEDLKNARNILLKKAIQLLSPKHREVLHLKYFEGMDSEEIAQIMSINLQSVYNLLSEALKATKKHITASYPQSISIFLSLISFF